MNDRVLEFYEGSTGSDRAIAEVRRRIDRLRDDVKAGPVLDIGCSQGILPLLLARDGISVVGLDRNPEAIRFARSRLEEEEEATRERVEFVCADIFDWDDGRQDGFATVVVALVLDSRQDDGLLDAALRHAQPEADVLIQVNWGRRDSDDPDGFTMSNCLDLLENRICVQDLALEDGRILVKGIFTDPGASGIARDGELLRRVEAGLSEKEAFLLSEVQRYKDWVARVKEQSSRRRDPSEDKPKWRKLAVERRRLLRATQRRVQRLDAEVKAAQTKLDAKQETILRLQEKLRALRNHSEFGDNDRGE